jgi:c-di-GMP-binding flagellar brake protein YcgR
VEERRASRRYKLILHVEIRIESDLQEFEQITGRTCDISLDGFYFRIGQNLSVGMKFGFSIMPPWEVPQTTRGFINGLARVVRVEEASAEKASDDRIDHVGVGAAIERYKFGQAESSD